MTSDELVGKVAARYLRDHLSEDDSTGVARYLLDCLTADQTAAIAKTILADTSLSQQVEIKLPTHFVGHLGLPSDVLTNERTTYFRNADCDKPVLLLANTGDDEGQSLKDLVSIDEPLLRERAELWVNMAADGLPLNEQHKKWWIKALQGLLEVRAFALDRLAQYILQTRTAIEDGQPILFALGRALPALHVPRDTAFFSTLNEKSAGQLAKWKTLYDQAIRKRACYLMKQTPTQALLVEDDLLNAFEKVKDAIPNELHRTITAFIRTDSNWNEEAAALAQCEWDSIKPLFDGLKREKFNLGQATRDFYDERESDLLTTDETDYLARLSKSKSREAQDDDEDFYRRHRAELKEQPSLKTKWDKFIYGAPIEAEDFLVGVALCLERLFDKDMPSSKRRLRITSDRRTRKDLRELNLDAGLFFTRRYRGLKELLGNRVSWDVGELMNFETVSDQWRKATKPYVNHSVAKSALQLKFTLELEVELSNGAAETSFKQLIWMYDPNAIACEFSGDWTRLSEHPLVYTHVNRQVISSKGRFQSLDLRDVSTLYAVYDRDRGSLISIYKKGQDISLLWPANLIKMQGQGMISEGTGARLLRLFQTFQTSYTDAISGFLQHGLACDALVKQAEDYGALLYALCKEAKGDRNREHLLQPLLQIGAVTVDGGRVTTIVTPWHPLRLAAMAHKAHQVASLVRHLLTVDDIFFGDPPFFFKELEQELLHPYYPEIVLGWTATKPELLSLSDHYLDYSLHESPIISNDGFNDTNENPSETASLIVDLTKRFLALYPHEKANLSIVLYNCDSARLPYAVVDKMNELHEDEEDMRCQIILRHRDGEKLRGLYEKIIESSEADADSFVSSEAAKDFMARLRIGIMADQAPVRDPKDGPPADIVFLQDVIARHAGVEWYAESSNPVESASFIPARWSRRRPSALDDMKSVVYLCCPVQTMEGWAFITALTTFLKGDWDGGEDKRLLPARKLDFNDPLTASIFHEIHDLGNWVVNYDELLDRRQLLNQNVKVIRYKQGVTQGRNTLISSTAPLTLLRSMVLGRIKDLNLELGEIDCQKLTERFINDANEVSGDIVLRAAKRGRNASELMGIVLSRYMMQHELGSNRRFGWYFLDDYAEWLGQREEQIADILTLSPEDTSDDKLHLAVMIGESKYIDIANLAAKRKESQKQLRDTMRRISDAVFGSPKRLDRDLWLSRFSDLMLNGIQFPANSPIDLSAWRRAVREGQCHIYLRGYSHVFVSGLSDAPECSDFAVVAEAESSYQEVFSRTRLQELVRSYWQDLDPTPIRRIVADQDIWKEQSYRKPSEQIRIVQRRTPPDEAPQNIEAPSGDIESPQLHALPSMPLPSVTPPTSAPHQESPRVDQTTKVSATWAYPQVSQLLKTYSESTPDNSADTEWLQQIVNSCKGALQQFQLQSKLLSHVLTPNAALLKFQGGANLTVEQVLRRRSEFLTTHKLNVISVRAEPGAVAIAIARPNRRVLHLPEVWQDWHPDCSHGNHELLIAVKEEDSGLLFLSPKSNAPHTLIAGSTGSGKSVLMQNIILGIACTNTPEQAQIILIDPKLGVDYFEFEDLPHLQNGIIDDQQKAILRLSELVAEMDRRYTVLRANKVANVFDLNRKPNATEHLPFLWVIHDEFAEWMMTEEYADDVSNIVGRLGVKARAAGISLVFAAQRPDARVMPMQLRANLGNRLVLRVDGEGTSEIALTEKGAERLLGKGHLAAKLEGELDIMFAQVPFVSSEFLSQVVGSLKENTSHHDTEQ
ncbi:MAG: DNA translocase FtsK [Deltaproteobacteria bacterium]|nr:DNA translocase FtsK [Deltaproteobacteria bacterium]